jgi:hypothetical protein
MRVEQPSPTEVVIRLTTEASAPQEWAKAYVEATGVPRRSTRARAAADPSGFIEVGGRRYRADTMSGRGMAHFLQNGQNVESTREYLRSIGASPRSAQNWAAGYRRAVRADVPMPSVGGRTTIRGRATRLAVWQLARRGPRLSSARIAEKLGVSTQRVRRILRSLGLRRP